MGVVGEMYMCRRLQVEKDDLICGGKQVIGPVLKCYEERGLGEEKRSWRRLWRGRDICGKDGRYWVEK